MVVEEAGLESRKESWIAFFKSSSSLDEGVACYEGEEDQEGGEVGHSI